MLVFFGFSMVFEISVALQISPDLAQPAQLEIPEAGKA